MLGLMSSSELARLGAEIDKVGRRVLRRVDPGARAMIVAVGVLVLLVAAMLPWVESATGWQLLFGPVPVGVVVGLVPRIFVVSALVFGVLASGLALATRIWGLAWTAASGCGFSTLAAVLAIWSQQSSASHMPGPGPGPGLLLAALTMLVLAIQWVKIAFSRA